MNEQAGEGVTVACQRQGAEGRSVASVQGGHGVSVPQGCGNGKRFLLRAALDTSQTGIYLVRIPRGCGGACMEMQVTRAAGCAAALVVPQDSSQNAVFTVSCWGYARNAHAGECDCL